MLTDEFDALLEEFKPAAPKPASTPPAKKQARKKAMSKNGRHDELTPAVMEAYERKPKNRRWRLGPGSTLKWLCNALEESTLQTLVYVEHEETMTYYVMPYAWWDAKPIKLLDNFDSTYWGCRPARGSTWRHYKGKVYFIMDNATHVGNGKHYVIYRNDGPRWARKAESWFDSVDAQTPRFTLVK